MRNGTGNLVPLAANENIVTNGCFASKDTQWEQRDFIKELEFTIMALCSQVVKPTATSVVLYQLLMVDLFVNSTSTMFFSMVSFNK